MPYPRFGKHPYTLILGICMALWGPAIPALKGGLISIPQRRGTTKNSSALGQDREIQDWSSEEVQKFLQDSPWAKSGKVAIAINDAGIPTSAQPPSVAGGVQMMKIESCCRTFEIPLAGSNLESATDFGSIESSKELGRILSFSARVLWFSSVSVRRAIVHQRKLQGMPLAQPDSALAPSNDFVLALSGSFLRLLEGLTSNEIRTISSLGTSRGPARRLSPVDYIAAQSGDDPMAFLIFPKIQDDTPALSREDRLVTFSMKGADFELEFEFPLEKMVIDGQVDW